MSAPLPGPLTGPHDESVLSGVTPSTVISVKATITDAFTSLSNFVRLSGTQSITSGILRGTGAIRHRDRVLTDNFKVSATVGFVDSGRTWLVTCASANFDRFYALEIESGTTVHLFKIVKGTGVTATVSGNIFGIILGILGFIVGILSDIVAAVFTAGQQVFEAEVGDVVAIWWDEETSTVRAYLNDVEVITLLVPRWELPHGEEHRHWGVVSGIVEGLPGAQFTSIVAQDV